jgi:hypothetical protein
VSLVLFFGIHTWNTHSSPLDRHLPDTPAVRHRHFDCSRRIWFLHMTQLLLLRLQQAAQLAAASSSSSLLPAAATAAQTCGLWTAAALWKQQQQQHPQLYSQLQLASNLPQHIQQPCAGISTCTAAADAALLRLNIPQQQLPCMLQSSTGRKQRLGNANTVKYPYRLPRIYSSRSWQLRDLEGRPKAAVELPGDIFNVPVRIDIMHQVCCDSTDVHLTFMINVQSVFSVAAIVLGGGDPARRTAALSTVAAWGMHFRHTSYMPARQLILVLQRCRQRTALYCASCRLNAYLAHSTTPPHDVVVGETIHSRH